MNRIALVFALAACNGSRPIDTPKPAPKPAGAPFDEVVVDTEPGLSGLSVDDTGAIWTVAERAELAYRITFDAAKRPVVQRVPVEGVPDGNDLEGIAALGGMQFALGTEGRLDGAANVLLAHQQGEKLAVHHVVTLTPDQVGIEFKNNAGAEGICGVGTTVVAALETAGMEAGKRWAPVVRIERDKVVRVHRVWLTSETGKISGLDCRLDRKGAMEVIAIERHFEVTRILAFTLDDTIDVQPRIAADIGPYVLGRLNLEGIAWLPNGDVIAVNDNQWKTITGSSLLLMFRTDAVK